ncbi:MAG: hypothetical protein P8164_06020 [Gammaproteobacteria bacterium]|jgi:hypothetical protein
MIACYVGGKGMYATAATWDVKTAVILSLEEGGIGYDTRFRYYRRQFPELSTADLARQICDPIENYDRDWPEWRVRQAGDCDDNERITAFFLERDRRFREEARAGIFCLDEAGFGSGVNVMRFIHAGKPVLGIYRSGVEARAVNVGNFLQLRMEYPDLMSLSAYQAADDMLGEVRRWLSVLPAARSR